MRETFRIEEYPDVEILSPVKLLERWYQQSVQGILLGSQHDVIEIHQHFGNLVSDLVRLNVRKIYFEKSVTWQSDLNEFLETGRYSTQWAHALKRTRLLSGDMEDPRFLFESVREYKNSGIELIFIDRPADRETGWLLSEELKDKTRDEFMDSQFDAHKPGEDKFVVICGNAHAALDQYQSYQSGKGNYTRSPLGALIAGKYKENSIRSIAQIASHDDKWSDIVYFINDRIPPGASPLVFDLSGGKTPAIPVFQGKTYQGEPVQKLFSGLIVFPHATFS